MATKVKFGIGTNPREIYDLLRISPSGFTSEQIAMLMRIKRRAAQDAITDLKAAGNVVVSDEIRISKAGAKGVVYRAVV